MRTATINFLVFIASIIFIGILIEAALRLKGFNPFGEFFENEGRAIFIQPSKNSQRIYEATPNARGHGWETEISINSYGFRDREYSLDKGDTTFRIAVLGDSITFGNRLAPDENYPFVLEEILAQDNTESNTVYEVLNFGLGGYDTLQEVATLKDIGLQFNPDLVVLGYCINDIGIASGNSKYVARLQKYGSPIYRSRLAQFIRIHLDKIEASRELNKANEAQPFLNLYADYLANIDDDKKLSSLRHQLEQQLHTSLTPQPFTRSYLHEPKLQRLRFAFEQLKQIQHQNGEKQFEVLIIIFPFLLETQDTVPVFNTIYDIVEHEAARLDFLTLNLYSTLHKTGFNKLLIKDVDGIHPNAEGHRVVAEEIARYLKSPGVSKFQN